MRTLKFTFITDDRFTKNIHNKILSMDKQLKKALENIPVVLTESCIRKLIFDLGEADGNNTQYRKTYYLKKLNRSITWNDVYGTINKIQAPYYQFV